VPISAGLSGALLGPAFTGSETNLATDSHLRYLSGLLLGIGVAFWAMLPHIERRQGPFRLLTAIVFAGGLARLFGLAVAGVPPAPMLFGLAMELVVTPLLCLCQGRVAKAHHSALSNRYSTEAEMSARVRV
jgi:hypothetical protein